MNTTTSPWSININQSKNKARERKRARNFGKSKLNCNLKKICAKLLDLSNRSDVTCGLNYRSFIRLERGLLNK